MSWRVIGYPWGCCWCHSGVSGVIGHLSGITGSFLGGSLANSQGVVERLSGSSQLRTALAGSPVVSGSFLVSPAFRWVSLERVAFQVCATVLACFGLLGHTPETGWCVMGRNVLAHGSGSWEVPDGGLAPSRASWLRHPLMEGQRGERKQVGHSPCYKEPTPTVTVAAHPRGWRPQLPTPLAGPTSSPSALGLKFPPVNFVGHIHVTAVVLCQASLAFSW